MVEIAASFAADRLGPDDMRSAREQRLPARKVLALFTPDHIHPHALGGADKWWNLSMVWRGPELKAKDAADTSRVAKVRRLDDKWRDFIRRTQAGIKPLKRLSRWQKRRVRR